MHNYSQYTDDILIQFISNDDAKAFTELYYRYKDKLFNFSITITGCSEKSKDIVQDIFTKIWEKRATLNGREIFSSFLFKMVRNQSIDVLRKWAKEKIFIDTLSKSANTIESNTPEENFIFRELDQNINKEVRRLPARQKQIFQMNLIDRLKQQEIANHLNLSISTVENTFGHSMTSIRRYLKDGLL